MGTKTVSSLPSAQLRTGAGTHNHRSTSLKKVVDNALNNYGRGVWLPAFAGTTARWNQYGRLIGRPFLFFQTRRSSRVVAVAIAIVAVEAVGIVVGVVIVMRGRIEESLPRTGIVVVVVGAPA